MPADLFVADQPPGRPSLTPMRRAGPSPVLVTRVVRTLCHVPPTVSRTSAVRGLAAHEEEGTFAPVAQLVFGLVPSAKLSTAPFARSACDTSLVATAWPFSDTPSM